ncbi:MAG: type II toxin-antitoxin system HicA family toxin [Elusimicrobia bacterium]|nr:type II toxin-antitoxin system HicA family toxin [Elusimicrobiota bacterium]
MSKLSVISATRMIRILRHLGFVLIRQKGSHAYCRHSDSRSTVLPMHKDEDLRRGLIRAILKDIEINPTEFDHLRHEV